MKLIIAFISSIVLTGYILVADVFAHGTSSDRLHWVNHSIERFPDHPALYVKRGRIHRDSEKWDLALEDYARAIEIDAQFSEAYYWQADGYLSMENYSLAKASIEQYLKHEPHSADGNRLLAIILFQQRAFLKAADYFDRAIEFDTKPPPQLYLERSESLLQLKPVPLKRIRAGLLAGLRRLPENVVLIDQLIHVSVSANSFSQALLDFELLPASLKNVPSWILRRAEINLKAGNKRAAADLYQDTLARLNEMPESRRNLPAFKAIRENAEKGIRNLSL